MDAFIALFAALFIAWLTYIGVFSMNLMGIPALLGLIVLLWGIAYYSTDKNKRYNEKNAINLPVRIAGKHKDTLAAPIVIMMIYAVLVGFSFVPAIGLPQTTATPNYQTPDQGTTSGLLYNGDGQYVFTIRATNDLNTSAVDWMTSTWDVFVDGSYRATTSGASDTGTPGTATIYGGNPGQAVGTQAVGVVYGDTTTVGTIENLNAASHQSTKVRRSSIPALKVYDDTYTNISTGAGSTADGSDVQTTSAREWDSAGDGGTIWVKLVMNVSASQFGYDGIVLSANVDPGDTSLGSGFTVPDASWTKMDACPAYAIAADSSELCFKHGPITNDLWVPVKVKCDLAACATDIVGKFHDSVPYKTDMGGYATGIGDEANTNVGQTVVPYFTIDVT